MLPYTIIIMLIYAHSTTLIGYPRIYKPIIIYFRVVSWVVEPSFIRLRDDLFLVNKCDQM